MYRKIFFILFIYLYQNIALANPDINKTILWYKPELPPLSIVNGPDAGNGYSDRLEKFLIMALDGYKHEVLTSPFKRTEKDMKNGLNICSVTLLKTPAREEFIAFTSPARLLLANDLIVRKQDLSKLNSFKDESGKILIERVIKSGKIRIGYSNGRSYTKSIDMLLEKYKGASNLIERVGNEGSKGLLRMLKKGYIDAMFAQPVEAGFHGRNLGITAEISQLQISGLKNYTVGYIGCSKTPWGTEVVTKINSILTQAVKRKDFRSFYEYFLNQDSKERYRKMYDEYFMHE